MEAELTSSSHYGYLPLRVGTVDAIEVCLKTH